MGRREKWGVGLGRGGLETGMGRRGAAAAIIWQRRKRGWGAKHQSPPSCTSGLLIAAAPSTRICGVGCSGVFIGVCYRIVNTFLVSYSSRMVAVLSDLVTVCLVTYSSRVVAVLSDH